ncbi:hypothetical protein ACJMK2_017705 [Sinanodonta woodiana]|uniref:Uncharacterized protein n=1 Tax=Sinanodonta woodiana TaxID=1069815 RepID=A0ABD3UB98_SINWO
MKTGVAQIHDVETVEIQQGRASTEQADAISSDEEISFQNEEVLQHAERTPPVPVRRSGRERRPSAWFTSGQYETSMTAVGQMPISVQQVTPEWRQKSDYISSLAQTSLFIGLEKEAAKAILDIISTTKN